MCTQCVLYESAEYENEAEAEEAVTTSHPDIDDPRSCKVHPNCVCPLSSLAKKL